MFKKFLFLFLIYLPLLFVITLNCKAEECVILLHGLARSHYSMSSLEFALKQKNYTVINEDYPSTKNSIEEIAKQYLPFMIKKCLTFQPEHIHFVTHSMGGLVLRKYMQDHKIPRLGRIVMLAPPNHGSKLADLYHDNWIFKFFTGPAGQELTTVHNRLLNTLHLKDHYQIGVIAGSFTFIPFNNFIFHEANDGKVNVSSTKIANMKDFIILPVSHRFMMNNYLVREQIFSFLSDGKFIHY